MPTYSSDIPDLHLIKEAVHYSDGTVRPNVRFRKNYKRTFYVTSKAFRNHKQKKEYETVDKLMRYECTQSELPRRVAEALGEGYLRNPQMRQLTASPYLYGSDISSTAIIKNDYMKQYPDAKTSYSVGYFDIETDVLHGTDDPIMAVFVFNGKIWQVATRDFFKGRIEVEDQVYRSAHKHIGEYIEKNNLEYHLRLVDDTVELIRYIIGKVHEESPDFLAIWNLDFDIPRILATLKKYGVDAKDIFSHPTLPPELRFCKYKKGSVKKMTASGQVKPKNPSEQWHSLYCPAGFYIIDAMSSYRFVRQGEQELAFYSLSFVLEENFGIRKLNFKEADGVQDGTLDWHVFMQERYPIEYAVYNAFDCIGMLELELKNRDLSQKVPIQNGITDFARFNSQTKRFADEFHFFIMEKGGIVATIPPKEDAETEQLAEGEEDEEDEIEVEQPMSQAEQDLHAALSKDVMSLRDWIVTLPSHLSSLGQSVSEESGLLKTLFRMFVYDSDAVSAYPSCTAVANVSRETTVRELIDILGINEGVFRKQNINLLQGHVNALEYCNQMFKLPRAEESLAIFADME